MTALLLFGVALPAIGFGLIAQNGGEVTLGLIALGMAAVSGFLHCLRRDWRKNHELLHGRRLKP